MYIGKKRASRPQKRKAVGKKRSVKAISKKTRVLRLGGVVTIPKEQIIRRRIPKKFTLAIGTIFNREDPYIKEWLEFHIKVGVDHFYLYDNGCSKESQALLKPYVDRRLVTYHQWPDSMSKTHIQREAYRHCLKNYGHKCFWMAFIDVDEFLFSRVREHQLNKLLSHYNHNLVTQIEVPRYNYGNSNHVQRPTGGVLVNYLMREKNPSNIKSIVNPGNLNVSVLTNSVHRFNNLFRQGSVMNATKSVIPFRINHYITKSTQEYLARNTWWKRRRKQGARFNPPGARLGSSPPERWNGTYDDAILSVMTKLNGEGSV